MSHAAIVLLSGGLDSAVVLACAKRDGFTPHCISFDYGQRHRHELVAAAEVARAGGAASHICVKLDLRSIGGSALTSDTIDVPKTASHKDEIPVTYVPARNLTFLSLSLGYAEVKLASDLYIGVNAVDYSGYPDCRPAFIRSFEATANLATKAGVEGSGFRVRTPLIELTKAAIIRLGADLGVDFSLTHSCYDPVFAEGKTLACGKCDSCRIRAEGFKNAGVADPTRYAK
ncbi:MAG: 7-cyano-7-deazaguanine synthase QueC [Phycisphaerales bacterium]